MRATEKMINYNIWKVDYQVLIPNKLKMNRKRYDHFLSLPPRGVISGHSQRSGILTDLFTFRLYFRKVMLVLLISLLLWTLRAPKTKSSPLIPDVFWLWKVWKRLSNYIVRTHSFRPKLHLCPPQKKKVGSKTRIRCFTSKTDFSNKLCYKVHLGKNFQIKWIYVCCPSCPHRVAQKCNFVHNFANNAAR